MSRTAAPLKCVRSYARDNHTALLLSQGTLIPYFLAGMYRLWDAFRTYFRVSSIYPTLSGLARIISSEPLAGRQPTYVRPWSFPVERQKYDHQKMLDRGGRDGYHR